MLIAIYLSASLLDGPQVPKEHRTSAKAGARTPGKTSQIVPPTHVIIDQPYPTAATKPETPEKTSAPEEMPLPRFGRPEWVIVYITAIYAFIAGWILIAIYRQARLMRRQIKDARKSGSEAAATATGTLVAIEKQAGHMERQAVLMEAQLKEMHEAGKQAAVQLSLTERLWLSTEIKVAGSIEVKGQEIRIPLLVEVRNVGKSPAIGIFVESSAYMPQPTQNYIPNKQKSAAVEIMARSVANPIFGKMLFPGIVPHLERHNIPVSIEDPAGFAAKDFYSVFVVLGVGYRSTVDKTATHCTVTVHELHRLDPQQPGMWLSLKKGESVPLDRVILTPSQDIAPIAE